MRSRHGQANNPGSYASATTGGFVIYEGRLELARLQLADFDCTRTGEMWVLRSDSAEKETELLDLAAHCTIARLV